MLDQVDVCQNVVVFACSICAFSNRSFVLTICFQILPVWLVAVPRGGGACAFDGIFVTLFFFFHRALFAHVFAALCFAAVEQLCVF